MDDSEENIPTLDLHPARQDAIHRALLTGLLANVGTLADAGEYIGVRGKKFFLFPGSSLFRRKPHWVMAAEVVETTKLYARTVAPAQPLWIERAASHLVKRDWTNAHWQSDIGRVLAMEKVTLQGLTLVSARKGHYGPIDPKLSREIFIQHALVLGDFQTRAPFFEHNQKLIAYVQSIEAKARRRDVLVDPKARFAFYDARIPARIYTADEFEKWRRVAEKQDPKLLFMAREDLMLHPAMGVTAELYPDELAIGPVTIPLEYCYELGDRADGVTATIPLAALNDLPTEPFDWLVPGFRQEMFLTLIRTLSRNIRVKFVPAPDYANAAAAELKPADGPVLDALARYLGKSGGEPVHATDFKPGMLPTYLQTNFRIVDAEGKEIAMGRDLSRIRRELGLRARASFTANPPPRWNRDGLKRWEFGDLPESVEISHGGVTVNGYPALIDAGDSVSLRLLESRSAALESTRVGIRRLFMLQVREEMRYLERTIASMERMSLFYATIGRGEDLTDELIVAIADRALFGDADPAAIRTHGAFAAAAENAWRRLSSAATEVIELVRQILDANQSLEISIADEFPPMAMDSIRDMRDQLAHLIHGGFISRTQFKYLQRIPRYLSALLLRLKKLSNAGLTRDVQGLKEVGPLWSSYKDEERRRRQAGTIDDEFIDFRWQLEELRVSVFAQELRAATPVSVQRLQRQWQALLRTKSTGL